MVRTLEEMQKLGRDNVEATLKSFGAFSKGVQAIATGHGVGMWRGYHGLDAVLLVVTQDVSGCHDAQAKGGWFRHVTLP